MDPANEVDRKTLAARLSTILIVVNDRYTQQALRSTFVAERYSVVVAGDGQTGFDLFLTERPAAVLLDLILPKISGEELCPMLKAVSSETPVIIVTAISEIINKVRLFELGADDFVTMPFSPRELIARVQAAIRRQRKDTEPSLYCFGECEVDFQKMSVRCSGSPVTLTALQFKLLRFFTENAERVLTRELLLNEVWGRNFRSTKRTVDNQILKLRQKLEPDPADPKHLITFYNAGYKFMP
jgi:DNA-binding response OmpR family regulator